MELVGERLDVVEHLLFVRKRIARDLDELREHIHHLAFHRMPKLLPAGRLVLGPGVMGYRKGPTL